MELNDKYMLSYTKDSDKGPLTNFGVYQDGIPCIDADSIVGAGYQALEYQQTIWCPLEPAFGEYVNTNYRAYGDGDLSDPLTFTELSVQEENGILQVVKDHRNYQLVP